VIFTVPKVNEREKKSARRRPFLIAQRLAEMELSYGAVEKIIRCQIHCLKIIRLGLPLQSIFLLPSFYALSLFDRGISKMYGWLLEHL
jgi:hypothetical protein